MYVQSNSRNTTLSETTERQAEAPIVRRLFASSPNDPRYHMLSHLSAKFKQPTEEQTHEPRAALFLNRFTRTLTIMYATSGIEQVIGISSEDVKGRSFYYCIAENCLEDAVKCLETAKSNDSIAYLRFWFRDPRMDDHASQSTSGSEDTDASMTDVTASEDEDSSLGLVHGQSGSPSGQQQSDTSQHLSSPSSGSNPTQAGLQQRQQGDPSPHSSGPATTGSAAMEQSLSSVSTSLTGPDSGSSTTNNPIELEAVVSCTSDGLVVCLRRARPLIPQIVQDLPTVQPQTVPQGIFAAPWGPSPVYFPPQPQAQPAGPYTYWPGMDVTYAPAASVPRGPAQVDLMKCIREVAVFAWALTGINGSLADYAVGKAGGDSQPQDGFPIWDPSHAGDGGSSATAESQSHAGQDGSTVGKPAGSGPVT